MCGPSLTETSLYGARLYTTRLSPFTVQQSASFRKVTQFPLRRLYCNPALRMQILTQPHTLVMLLSHSLTIRQKETLAQPLYTFAFLSLALFQFSVSFVSILRSSSLQQLTQSSRHHHYPQTQNLCFARHVTEKTS